MTEILVIGAGVVGGMIARELTRYTPSVAIAEAACDVALGATRANSAIVHAGFDAKEGSLKALLNVRGSKMMKKVCSELGVKYKNNGSLVVGFNEEDKETLLGLLERGNKNGVEGLKLLSREELLSIEPNIGDEVAYALHAPTGAIVCPYELCMAAVGNAMDNGASLYLDFKVVSIEKQANGYLVKAEDGREIFAKFVVNGAGAYSDEISALIGDESFSVKPRRGEYMLLDKECGSLIGHTVFSCPSKMGKGILVSPTVDGNLLLGPTAEDIEDKTDVRTTAEGMAKIRAGVSRQVKGVNFSKVITSFSGVRSSEKNGDFIIRQSEKVDGFIHVAAIDSPGLTCCVAIADYAIEQLRAMGLVLTEKADFDPVRENPHAFREMSDEEKDAYIKQHPAYGKIVCRCETVSEGEIRDAIRRNPPARDIDGVKRRTRSGMGRCQGGFCMPYVMRLLSEENGEPMEKITKNGEGSAQLTGKL